MTPKIPNYDLMYDEETYDRVCAERDAAQAEAERLREAIHRASICIVADRPHTEDTERGLKILRAAIDAAPVKGTDTPVQVGT